MSGEQELSSGGLVKLNQKELFFFFEYLNIRKH